MTTTELVAILVMVGYAVFRQTRISTVTGRGRFKLALVYGVIGLAVGGFAAPHGATAVGVLTGGALLSVVTGMARARFTRLWLAEDGTVLSQGTPLSVFLFVALVAAKFAIGTVAYVEHVRFGGGFGEVMVMIAIMVAVQAELIWRRARTLSADVALIPAAVGPTASELSC